MVSPEEQRIFDSLVKELEVDTASAEYYATMAFEERLHNLLEKEPATTYIQASRVTMRPLNTALFTPNHFETVAIAIDEDTVEDVVTDAFTFNIEGSLSFDDDRILIDASVRSDLNDSEPVAIQNSIYNNDEFYLYKKTSQGMITQMVNTKELIYTLSDLADIDPRTTKTIFAKFPEEDQSSPETYQKILEHLWIVLGEETGSSKKVQTLTHQLANEDPSISEYIKLTYTEEETTSQSLIHMKLENIKELNDFDVNDIHTLELTFTQKAENEFDQYAERLIASGILPLDLIGIAGVRQHDGRKTVLNLNDPDVIELFVDWFDELISEKS